jgi:hypothetical protein
MPSLADKGKSEVDTHLSASKVTRIPSGRIQAQRVESLLLPCFGMPRAVMRPVVDDSTLTYTSEKTGGGSPCLRNAQALRGSYVVLQPLV